MYNGTTTYTCTTVTTAYYNLHGQVTTDTASVTVVKPQRSEVLTLKTDSWGCRRCQIIDMPNCREIVDEELLFVWNPLLFYTAIDSRLH